MFMIICFASKRSTALAADLIFLFVSLAARGAALWLDTSSTNAAIVNAYKAAGNRYNRNHESGSKTRTKYFDGSNEHSYGPIAVHKISPISLAKAIKNELELEGMRNCHLRLPYLILVIIKVDVFACQHLISIFG